MRFIKENDYGGNIKAEIKKLLTGTVGENTSMAQIRAEDTAIATIREYIGGRYDCDLIFIPHTSGDDRRNLHVVKIVLILTLFDLYQQVGTRDMPEHRKIAYDDAISWLKDVGRGTVKAQLPALLNMPNDGDIRFFSRTPRRHKW